MDQTSEQIKKTIEEQKIRQATMQETEQRLIKEQQIAQEDTAAYEKYRNPEYTKYKASRKKSTSRQYRNYELYKAAKEKEMKSQYGLRANEADYIKQSQAMIVTEEYQEDTNYEQILLNICKTSEADQSITKEDMRLLTDAVYRSTVHEGRRDAETEAVYEKEKEQAIQEIYYRQIEMLEQKYGKKLAKLSPKEYLERLPELEQDFATIGDMHNFFAHRAIDSDAVEAEQSIQVRMANKLSFYYDVWQILKDRYDTFVRGEDSKITQKGELTKEAKQEYEKRIKECMQNADRSQAFRKVERKRKNIPDILVKTEETKRAAGDVLKAIAEEAEKLEKAEQAKETEETPKAQEADKDKQIEQAKEAEKKKQMDELSRKINDYNTYLREKEILAHTQADVDAGKELTETELSHIESMKQAVGQYEKEGEIKSEEELNRVSGELSKLQEGQKFLFNAAKLEEEFNGLVDEYLEMARNFHPERVRDEELLSGGLTKIHEILEQDEKLNRIYRGLRNESYVTDLEKWIGQVEKRGIQPEERERYEKEKPVIAKFHELCSIVKNLPNEENMKTLIKSRLEDIVKCGYSTKRSFMELKNPREQLDNIHHDDKTELKELSAKEARDIEKGYVRLGGRNAEYLEVVPKTVQLLKGIQKLRAMKEQSPDYYYLAQTSVELAKSEQMLQLEPLLSRNLYLLRKRYRIDENGEYAQTFQTQEEIQELPRELDELRNMYNDWSVGYTREVNKTKKNWVNDTRTVLTSRYEMESEEEIPETPEAKMEQYLKHFAQFRDSYDRLSQSLREGNYRDYAIVQNVSELQICYNRIQKIKDSDIEIENEELKSVVEQYGDLDTLSRELSALLDYGEGLLFMKLGNASPEENPQQNADKANAETLLSESRAKVERIRAKHLTQDYSDEIHNSERRARMLNELGYELKSSYERGEVITPKGFIGVAGGMIGYPLQFFNWMIREKRTMNHGKVNYQKACEKQDELLEKVPEMKESTLPSYQRGDADYVPAVELEKYFSSDWKKQLKQQVNLEGLLPYENDADLYVEEYRTALQAIDRYRKVVGIVNTDTTEMEMAYLDVFRSEAQSYIEGNAENGDKYVQSNCAFLKELLRQMDEKLSGTLSETMDKKELEHINLNTIAYVEDTTYSANLEESNIRDIPLFLHEPNINDVRQSSIGDCWYVSAISAVVNANPDYIRSMFHDLGDGNVLVRMFRENPIEQEKPMPVYFKLRKQYETGWGNACDCTWVQLLEKAYALGGFNQKNNVKIEGNRIYNVTEELTMGDIPTAVFHLTGKVPPKLYGWKEGIISLMLTDNMKRGMVAGLNGVEVSAMGLVFEEYEDRYKANINPKTSKEKTELTLHHLKECMEQLLEGEDFADFERLYLERVMGEAGTAYLNELKKKPQEEQANEHAKWKQELKEYYWKIVEENMQKMSRGEPLEFTDAQKQEYREDGRNPEREEQIRKERQAIAKVHGDQNSPYALRVREMSRLLIESLDKHETIASVIPHCTDIIDYEEMNGRIFFLMRDPFNIYNYEYTYDKKGKKQIATEALPDVVTKREANRHLVGNSKEEIEKGGFRGTSWIEADDMYEILESGFSVNPDKLQIPSY